eukprot:Awhi_evm1s14335
MILYRKDITSLNWSFGIITKFDKNRDMHEITKININKKKVKLIDRETSRDAYEHNGINDINIINNIIGKNNSSSSNNLRENKTIVSKPGKSNHQMKVQEQKTFALYFLEKASKGKTLVKLWDHGMQIHFMSRDCYQESEVLNNKDENNCDELRQRQEPDSRKDTKMHENTDKNVRNSDHKCTGLICNTGDNINFDIETNTHIRVDIDNDCDIGNDINNDMVNSATPRTTSNAKTSVTTNIYGLNINDNNRIISKSPGIRSSKRISSSIISQQQQLQQQRQQHQQQEPPQQQPRKDTSKLLSDNQLPTTLRLPRFTSRKEQLILNRVLSHLDSRYAVLEENTEDNGHEMENDNNDNNEELFWDLLSNLEQGNFVFD